MTSPDRHFPILHRVHRQGWINDPNGIHRLAGRWHVFFQYNPYSARHDRIRWGHVSSEDLVTWREEPLGPEPRAGEADRDGCWSGIGFVTPEGTPALVYSGVDGVDNQLARVIIQHGDPTSTTWTPVPGTAADIPDVPGLFGLRDPFLLELEGRRIAIQGAGIQEPDGRQVPAILAWDATDLDSWRFLGTVLTGDDEVAAQLAPANIWECPQLVQVDGHWVLMVSLWTTGGGTGADSGLEGVVHLRGELTLDGDLPVFTPRGGGRVDEGPDFYAPQAVADGERTLLWGWTWEGRHVTQEQADAQGWAGALTLPRELHLDGDVLVSRLAQELRALRGEHLEVTDATLDLDAPARVEAKASGGLRVELVSVEGDATPVTGFPAGSATVVVDASIIEILPEGAPASTTRVRVGDGERLRLVGDGLEAWLLRLPQDPRIDRA